MSAPRPDSAGKTRHPMRLLPAVIFMSRWLQVPLYLGLIDVVMISNLLIMVIVGRPADHTYPPGALP